jgi:hypothetical protein
MSTGPLGDLERANFPMDPAAVRRRRIVIVVAWLLLSAWEGAAIYLWFMKNSQNPSPEVGAALAMSTCWIPVIGTAFAIMAAVWTWALPWWIAVAMFLGPRLALVVGMRAYLRRQAVHAQNDRRAS